MTDVDFYINFAIHAILGRLDEADAILRARGSAVRRIADEIAADCPIDPAPLYRGILLDPAQPFALDHRLFLSWSEDPGVAAWFACPRSAVSRDLARLQPELRGYLATLHAQKARVLFHHSWASALGGLACFAILHPFMGQGGKQQIEWSLQTQREVITEPVPDLEIDLAPEFDATALEALERRLSPPWIIEAEGIRT